ncbi:hypothetical protein K1719_045682 [Acacia pycnantha]|nr:hypothetical protein K1719_045682 [Acacia pycnantha]
MRLENVKDGRKGNLNVATEVFQEAPSLHMVEMRKAKVPSVVGTDAVGGDIGGADGGVEARTPAAEDVEVAEGGGE